MIRFRRFEFLGLSSISDHLGFFQLSSRFYFWWFEVSDLQQIPPSISSDWCAAAGPCADSRVVLLQSKDCTPTRKPLYLLGLLAQEGTLPVEYCKLRWVVFHVGFASRQQCILMPGETTPQAFIVVEEYQGWKKILCTLSRS